MVEGALRMWLRGVVGKTVEGALVKMVRPVALHRKLRCVAEGYQVERISICTKLLAMPQCQIPW